MLDWHFDDNSQLIKGYKHLHIPVDDVDDENLLAWFQRGNRFIEEGLNYRRKKHGAPETQQDKYDGNEGVSGVLVHW